MANRAHERQSSLTDKVYVERTPEDKYEYMAEIMKS